MPVHILKSTFSGRSVLVTGHTGFKGSWLTLWLAKLGANVTGASLPPDQGPDNLFDRAEVAESCDSRFVDIRDGEAVARLFNECRPEIVFHMAAQPLVRRSYRDPVATFATNVMGTAHVLEAARQSPSVRTVVCVTTDKVYDNREWCWPYRETDALGGADPYSASKSAAEMVARSYMTALQSPDGFRMATARGGNVVGGGDWSEDRIVPDIVRAIRAGEPLVLRNPAATRPWQHVLELCVGYLVLAARLTDGWPSRERLPGAFVGAYNFGPDSTHEMSVGALVRQALVSWRKPDHPVDYHASPLHESNYLRLDSSRARADLGWSPLLSFEQTIAWTAEWYDAYIQSPSRAKALVIKQIEEFEALGESQGMKRTSP